MSRVIRLMRLVSFGAYEVRQMSVRQRDRYVEMGHMGPESIERVDFLTRAGRPARVDWIPWNQKVSFFIEDAPEDPVAMDCGHAVRWATKTPYGWRCFDLEHAGAVDEAGRAGFPLPKWEGKHYADLNGD